MLAAHWTFDLGTIDGRTVTDTTGSGLVARLDETVEIVPGRTGAALSFDDSAQAVIPAVPQLVLSQTFGFSLAFNINVTGEPNGEWRGVVYKPVADHDARGIGIWLYPDEMGLRVQLFTAKGPEFADSRADLPLDGWTHVVLAVDIDEMYLYVGGRLDVGVPLEHPVVTATGPIYLGRGQSGIGFTGMIDDLRIYSSTLSAEAVRALAV